MATPSQWLEGARPRTLPAAFAPVIAATGLAVFDGGFVWHKALLALVVAVALQVGVNYANDYSDGIRGTDDERVGPLRLTGSGLATPSAVKGAAFVALGIAGVAGIVLAATTAWWLLAVGLCCLLGAWFYTGGSKPYGYAGWGEVSVFTFFGLVAVTGTYFVQVEAWSWTAMIAGIGVGALACAINLTNNLRDIPTDVESGKRTLAVLLGDQRTRRLYVAFVALSAVAVLAIAAATTWWTLTGLLFVAVAAPAVRVVVSGAQGPALIPALAQTGKAELAWSVLLALPLILH